MSMTTQQYQVDYVEVQRDLDMLEGTCYPMRSYPVRTEVGYVLLIQVDVALVGVVHTADAVEQSGLPGSIGSYYSKNPIGRHLEAYVRQYFEPTEGHADLVDPQ